MRSKNSRSFEGKPKPVLPKPGEQGCDHDESERHPVPVVNDVLHAGAGFLVHGGFADAGVFGKTILAGFDQFKEAYDGMAHVVDGLDEDGGWIGHG